LAGALIAFQTALNIHPQNARSPPAHIFFICATSSHARPLQ
jgi:hypothetical protein